MKNQIEQQEYFPPEVEGKIRKYGRIRNGLIALGAAGFISSILSVTPIFSNYERPEIAKTYQNAQTSLRTLQSTRKNLTDKLPGLPYQTPEIEEFEKTFNREYNKRISKLDKVIESIEEGILEIESNPEFRQYQQNKKARGRKSDNFYFGGLLAIVIGWMGWMYPQSKKDKLKRKYKK